MDGVPAGEGPGQGGEAAEAPGGQPGCDRAVTSLCSSANRGPRCTGSYRTSPCSTTSRWGRGREPIVWD